MLYLHLLRIRATKLKILSIRCTTRKYCIDVLNQIKAAKAALVRIESNVLKKHVESCVVESFKNKKALDNKVEELLKLINK